MNFWRNIFFIIAFAALLPACKTTNINSQAPDAAAPSSPRLPQIVSVINVPISIPVSQVESRINQELNGTIYQDNSFESDNIKMTVTKNGRITVTADNNQLSFAIPLHIYILGRWQWQPCGICPTLSKEQSAEFDMVVKTSSTVSIGENWQIKTKTTGDYDWGQQKPSFSVGPITIPLSSVIDLALKPQMDKIFARLDAEIQKRTNIKDYVQRAWVAAQEPIMVDKTYNTWLFVSPIGVSATPMQTNAGKINITVGIKAYIGTVSGDMPHPIVNNILPNLEANNGVDDGFSVGLSGQITYAFASQLLQSEIGGQTYRFDSYGYQIKVDSAALMGNADNALIRLDLEGKQIKGGKSIKGTVYMTGIPYYDPDDMSIKVKDLQYSVKTRNVLVSSANWLLKAGLENEMKKHLVFSLKNRLDSAKQMLQASINNDVRINENAYLKGIITDIEPQCIYLTPYAMVAIVNAKGKITIVVDKL